jgi:uncharacterized protein YjbI with pentapeptide repeats
MNMSELKRIDGTLIATGRDLLSVIYENLADLRGANLGEANLRGANLGLANLLGADLRGANLLGADLRGADLRGADLGWADLRGADLGWADLGWADLGWAELRGADINWQSHDLISELLRQNAGANLDRLKIAGLLLVCRDKCWNWFLAQNDPETEWALGVLRKYVKGNDVAPDVLRALTMKEG